MYIGEEEEISMIKVNNLSVYYDGTPALENITLIINQKELVVLIGPNGAGKSTLLKAIAGLVKIHAGEIWYDGEIINNMKTHELVKKGIVLVPENRRIFSSMTVFENLEMGAYIRTRDSNYKKKENLEKVFFLFPILKQRIKQKAGTLSTGEQQMLSIGRALMLTPKLLMLDEPSQGLSPKYIEIIFQTLREINKNGTTILFVEQNTKALKYADRGYIFDLGKISFEAKSSDLLIEELARKYFILK